MRKYYGFSVGAVLVMLFVGIMPALCLNVSAEYQEKTMYKRGVWGVDLRDWYEYGIGEWSGEVTRDMATVMGTYDDSNTVPGSGEWNGYWLVSDESFLGGLDFSANVTVNSALGVEWMAGIGVVMNESASVQLENSITWGSRIYTAKGENISPEAATRSIELSVEKYCSVGAMLRNSLAIKSSFEIVQDWFRMVEEGEDLGSGFRGWWRLPFLNNLESCSHLPSPNIRCHYNHDYNLLILKED